jgi:hypothetical protein
MPNLRSKDDRPVFAKKYEADVDAVRGLTPTERLAETTARIRDTQARLHWLSGVQALTVADMYRRRVSNRKIRLALGNVSRRTFNQVLREATQQPQDMWDYFLPQLIGHGPLDPPRAPVIGRGWRR